MQKKEEHKLTSKTVQFTPTIFSKSTQMQLQETNDKSVNTVIWQKSIGIQTCLPCQQEIEDAITDLVEELVLNVEKQFPHDPFNRGSVHSNTTVFKLMYCDLGNTIHFSIFMSQIFPPSQKITIPKYNTVSYY